MKTLKLFALVGIFSIVLTPTALFCQHMNADDHPNYVVIGAFSVHKNAIRFTNHTHEDLNMPAQLELNTDRKLYYVYVMSTTDRSEAVKIALKLRSESEFTDTWVYSGDFRQSSTNDYSSRGVDINPVTQQRMSKVSPNEQKQSSEVKQNFDGSNAVNASTAATAKGNSGNSETTVTEAKATTKNETTIDVKTPTTSGTADESVDGKKFFFKLYRGVDNEPVEGDVDAIDVEKARKIASYKGNATVRVSPPSVKSGTLALTCEVFGYRKVQRDINYQNPESDDITADEQGNVVVPFELVRLQKGDIAVMYNVYFYKDAAVMRPESRFEVNSLLEMMKENPKYKIKIHGHTNGGASGKIIEKAKDTDNYFSLSQTKEGFGSAKKLSSERAEIIKDYLVNMGIPEDRMSIKAWGGKRPIYDKHHSRAQENVRVEIEILEDK
jgi:outer membrane protein OmpA-like peptidoglycan-associated protein